MKLQMFARTAEKKGDAKRLRREGKIPAVIYTQGKAGESIAVESSAFQSLLRQVQSGRLPTTVFTLVDDKKKERRVIIKDIQYFVTNYDIIHLDFEELHDNVMVNVKVPIECLGLVDCVGVKLGGALRQAVRYLRVRCLPNNIPAAFELDIRNMNLFESRRLADLQIPETVRPLMNLNTVAAIIVKR